MVKIPRCMSTQHPDNVNSPFFADECELDGATEVLEAYYAFSHFGCEEQMWDCEGKEYDNYVIKKLLASQEPFFRKKKLGKDVFITLRVPNPDEDSIEGKVLLEALDSIPRSFDVAKCFYGDDIVPIFEVILPMTTNAESLDRIYDYYKKFVIGKQNMLLEKGDITVAQWLGEFHPKKINVIPLFEDYENLLKAEKTTREYLSDKKVEYQRVFLARSDPAMNYGNVSATLLCKIALSRLHKLSAELGIPIYPMLGVGSAPFRGNLKPGTVDRVTREYPSVYTYTIQSAFKYDHSFEHVMNAIKKLNEREIEPPQEMDEERCIKLIDKYSKEYHNQVMSLAGLINNVARFVPSRRKRNLHIGMFGYSRNMEGVKLPRAITFTASLYSVGIPPEILGLNALTKDDIDCLKQNYAGFEEDLRDSLRYFNPDSVFLPDGLKSKVSELLDLQEINQSHKEYTDYITDSIANQKHEDLQNPVIAAAEIRQFLG